MYQTSSHVKAHLVVNLDPLVNNASIQNSGNEVVSDSLDLVERYFQVLLIDYWRPSQYRPLRINTNNDTLWA